MDTPTAAEGALCEVCYVGHYALDSGMLICDQCGTQSQVRTHTCAKGSAQTDASTLCKPV